MSTTEDTFDAISVTVRGSLRVTYVHGRYGAFPIGTLFTDIGHFTVRDAWLETLEAGEYPGSFSVKDFSLYSYKAFGEVRTTIRASVEDYTLDGYEETDCPAESLPDPIEEEASPEELEDFSRQENPQRLERTMSTKKDLEASKFLISFAPDGKCWALGDDYRIDNTIGRANIVQCKTALQSLGYAFDPQEQIWRMAK